MAAHASSGMTGYEQDGYSKLYMIFICLAALFYLFIGLFFLNKILIQYNVLPVARSLTLLTTVFATNIFYYTVVEAGMSHIYSFGCVTMFLYFVKSYFLKKQNYQILLSAALFGLIILLRPINGLVILTIPFLSGSSKSLLDGFSNLISKPKLLTFSSIIILLLLSIQPIIYKIAVNQFFVYSYEYEKFNFNDPHIFDILFSYKKGLFLYTPVLLLSLTGGIYLFKRNRYEFYSLLLFLTILTYLLSSWWNWWYGGSFSSRVYMEYIPLFSLLLGISLSSLSKGILKNSFTTLIFACILLCQIQTYQYRYYQIHWENMTKEKYWEMFLRIDKLV
ncbi:MAG: hypothetical protein IPP71_09725 [Bacteroidetes bacterium]|nr:hypothetical protein [Bacteroidota bacterium]